MTICLATTMYFPRTGGIPVYYLHLTRNLLSEGHSVLVLTIDLSLSLDEDEVVEMPGQGKKIVLKKTFTNYYNQYTPYFRLGGYAVYEWIAAGLAMRDWLKQNHRSFKIDIVETMDYGGIGVFLSDLDLPPLIVNAHSSVSQLTRYNYIPADDHAELIQKLESLSFKHCDSVLAHSPMNQEDLNQFFNIRADFSRAPWSFEDIPASSLTASDKNVVFASLQNTKGAEMMAEAVSIIQSKDDDFVLNWTGADTYTAPQGERMSQFLQKKYPQIWNKQFHWEPEVEASSVLEKMNKAGLVIIPSLWDTFNYCALEAVFLQKPLLITNTTGASYLFEGDEEVMIIPPEAEKISALLLDTGRMKSWKGSVNGKTAERLKEYFSPHHIISERKNIYNKLLDTSRASHIPGEYHDLLRQYTTPFRKYYYSLRKKAKRILLNK